jgi:hypothetical protein
MPEGWQLTTQELAELIADALVDARLVARERFKDAAAVIAEEIEARKGVGDY